MSVRQAITRRSNHFRTYIPSLKNGRPTPCESMLEGLFIRLCELSPQVKTYVVQPSRETLLVDDHFEQYIPDVRVFFENGTEGWFEIKPEARLLVSRVATRMAAAKAHFSSSGRSFQVITDTWLKSEPRAKNVEKLLYHRRAILAPTEFERCQRELTNMRPAVLSELFSIFGADTAWRLLGVGMVGINLEETITSTSPIYLTGGHRHANLLA